MLQHRPHAQLPSADLGWLKAHHHIRVDGKPDPVHVAVGSLYVWNDDEFAPGSGFPLHFHRDVEIVTYVRSGTVAHEDVLGNAYELREGDVQAMTAGTGIRHSEYNRGSQPLRIFQLWFEPGRKGETPRYAMRRFPEAGAAGTLKVLASGLPEADGSDHLPLSAAARLLGARIARGEEISYRVPQGNKLYVVASRGELRVNDLRIREGDGVAVSDESELRFEALADADLVIAEVP